MDYRAAPSLSRAIWQRDGNAREIGVPLAHKQIAALTGMTRVTVTRVLKRLRENGKSPSKAIVSSLRIWNSLCREQADGRHAFPSKGCVSRPSCAAV
ncbi:helix-turn-helix domain-containing protein [Pantoea sp. Tr-811]|uniref:helix-turn-helix domain-containing protein n=1 Tax=Pantoea sp. Tr-811 TaxID=2608361 RepID=UPI00196569C4